MNDRFIKLTLTEGGTHCWIRPSAIEAVIEDSEDSTSLYLAGTTLIEVNEEADLILNLLEEV